ncbi:MAG: UDP-N-acetylglucosamine 1-carboxyvinyltransferase [Bacteroidales bacterium]|nr:UDP-N-acetylglucosamine 1-carboxyvinyltransferase [Bacteroidales bacterium]MDY0216712.1 UDP-N-acetylglucosamine 1-carboxyvinyltransferase [Bacteroidales bacterium]
MAYFEIEGGYSLHGEITPQGAKNEALQIICAVLLTDQKVTLHNVPDIIDVNNLIRLIENLGVLVESKGGGVFEFEAKTVNIDYLKTPEFLKLARSIRGSVMLIGPLLARFGRVYAAKPGGDKIGRRKLDTHFIGMQKLGASFDFCDDSNVFELKAEKLTGCYMLLDEASVTGTANIVMAAVMAEGTTTIFNAACEPYLSQLCKMLNRMGAKITGVGSNLLTIEGVTSLNGCEHTMLPDMIEIGSFIGLAAMTQSHIRIKNVSIENLGVIPDVFRRLGVIVIEEGDDLIIPEQKSYEVETFMDGSIMTISDAPWPGFTPDLISIILVTAINAKGSVLVHQKMFESRLFFVDKLIDMGAQIILCDPHRATVIGLDHKYPLKGIDMVSPDIRAGVAQLFAALSAKGKSRIYNIEQIERGYQNIDGRLKQLGAKIKRCE